MIAFQALALHVERPVRRRIRAKGLRREHRGLGRATFGRLINEKKNFYRLHKFVSTIEAAVASFMRTPHAGQWLRPGGAALQGALPRIHRTIRPDRAHGRVRGRRHRARAAQSFRRLQPRERRAAVQRGARVGSPVCGPSDHHACRHRDRSSGELHRRRRARGHRFHRADRPRRPRGTDGDSRNGPRRSPRPHGLPRDYGPSRRRANGIRRLHGTHWRDRRRWVHGGARNGAHWA